MLTSTASKCSTTSVFTANSGEILGIAGISGCGQKELLEAIAGLQDIEAGKITYSAPDGEVHNLVGKDVLQIRKLGISLSFVPEDRLGMGLVGNMDLIDNVMLKSYRDGKRFFADRKSPKKLAEEIVKELDVSTPSVSTEIRKLSGGNVPENPRRPGNCRAPVSAHDGSCSTRPRYKHILYHL